MSNHKNANCLVSKKTCKISAAIFGDLRFDTWPWTEWYHFDCFWGDAFEEFYNDNREKWEDVDIEDLIEGYRFLSEEDQENADDSLSVWMNICNGQDEDEDGVSFVTPEVEHQNETPGNDENRNDKKKENLPKDQNGNKTNRKDEKKVVDTKIVAETEKKGLKREIDPVSLLPEKKIRTLNAFVGFL